MMSFFHNLNVIKQCKNGESQDFGMNPVIISSRHIQIYLNISIKDLLANQSITKDLNKYPPIRMN